MAGKRDGSGVRFCLHLLGGRPGHLCLTPLLHWTVGQGERSHSPGQQTARKESWGQGSAAPPCVGKPGTQGHQCPGATLFWWGYFACAIYMQASVFKPSPGDSPRLVVG